MFTLRGQRHGFHQLLNYYATWSNDVASHFLINLTPSPQFMKIAAKVPLISLA
jgi:hypothetical protein